MAGKANRKAIAEAAAQEFLLHGYAGTSLSAIAKRLELTKGALSYHFPTKADFAGYFIQTLRTATAQARAYATSEYPECGARRLLLYFRLISAWRATEPRLAAAVALFTDRASPTFEAEEVIKDWLDLSVEALESARESDFGLTTLESAEIFLAMNMGSVFFERHVRLNSPGSQKLRFVRAGLTAAGVANAHLHTEEVLSKYKDKLPTFDYSRIDHY